MSGRSGAVKGRSTARRTPSTCRPGRTTGSRPPRNWSSPCAPPLPRGHRAVRGAAGGDRGREARLGRHGARGAAHPDGREGGRAAARRRGPHPRRALVELPPAQTRPGRAPRGVVPGGDLLPSGAARAGLRRPEGLHRGPLARRDDDRRRRRHRPRPPRLPRRLGAARLRPLLPERHGRPRARVEVQERPRPRVALLATREDEEREGAEDDAQGSPQLYRGDWGDGNGRETEPVYDPATGEAIAETPLSTKEDVDRAVEAASAAFAGWSKTPVTKRVQVLFQYKMLLEEHFEELRELVTLENGKDTADAGGEVRRGIEVVEFACGMPTLMMGETVRDVARGIDNVSYRYPLGVVAAIVPFNFPCMIPLWTMPIAIGAGNTYILKPSERTPLTSQRLVELLIEAGVPEGVVNVVNGAHDAVNGILEHPGIEAVSFVGSQPVAEHVYRHGAAHGKRVQALAGAKNSMIVMPDAVLEKAVPNIISSAYGNAGERCLAGSVLVTVGDAGDRVVEAVGEAAKDMKVGPGYEDGELTPLIRESRRVRRASFSDRPSWTTSRKTCASPGRRSSAPSSRS